MPEKFYQNCVPYHDKRSLLSVDFAIEGSQTLSHNGLSFVSTPGHTADSICVILEDEVIFTGDTILPNITPHPSLAYAFKVNRQILPERYRSKNTVYGLINYIKSLNKIASLSSQPIQATFPGHRLFFDSQFNIIHSSAERDREIIQFHIDRCRDILRITDNKPAGLDEIVVQYFSSALLAGAGKAMARDEIIAHIEIMEECGDILWVGENKDLVQSTGSNEFLSVMGSYLN